MEKGEKYIKEVIKFPNGMCAVFDENMKQWPEFQGVFKEMRKKIFEKLAAQDYEARLLLDQ